MPPPGLAAAAARAGTPDAAIPAEGTVGSKGCGAVVIPILFAKLTPAGGLVPVFRKAATDARG